MILWLEAKGSRGSHSLYLRVIGIKNSHGGIGVSHVRNLASFCFQLLLQLIEGFFAGGNFIFNGLALIDETITLIWLQLGLHGLGIVVALLLQSLHLGNQSSPLVKKFHH